MDEIDILLRQARSSLGPLCYGACAAKCCKRGKLLIDKHQVPLFSKKGIVTPRKDGYFELALPEQGCSRLNTENKCEIFSDPLRPKMCDEYPLLRRGNTIFVSSSCTGFTKGLLVDFIKIATEKGFKIIVQ